MPSKESSDLQRLGGFLGGGALEPVFVFWYKFRDGKFERHVLSYSNLEPYFRTGNNEAPPNYVIGVGMRLSVGDLNGDGRQDIVVACRTGLYVFFNKGYMARTRAPSPLPARDSYPGNIQWDQPRTAPRPGGKAQ